METAFVSSFDHGWQLVLHDVGGSEKVGAYEGDPYSSLTQRTPDLHGPLLPRFQSRVFPGIKFGLRNAKIRGNHLLETFEPISIFVTVAYEDPVHSPCARCEDCF